jgi:hypothetical protein
MIPSESVLAKMAAKSGDFPPICKKAAIFFIFVLSRLAESS